MSSKNCTFSSKPDKETLHVNDRIVVVNGVEGDVWQMAKQLLAFSLLLKVCSHWGQLTNGYVWTVLCCFGPRFLFFFFEHLGFRM